MLGRQLVGDLRQHVVRNQLRKTVRRTGVQSPASGGAIDDVFGLGRTPPAAQAVLGRSFPG